MSNSLGNQMSKFPALKKSDCEQIALVALNKRVTVSNLLMKKEWLCVKRSCSIKKSDMRDSLVIWANCLKKIIFSPFLCPRVKRSHRSSLSCSSLSCSLLSCSFLKSDRSDSQIPNPESGKSCGHVCKVFFSRVHWQEPVMLLLTG